MGPGTRVAIPETGESDCRACPKLGINGPGMLECSICGADGADSPPGAVSPGEEAIADSTGRTSREGRSGETHANVTGMQTTAATSPVIHAA